MRGDSQLDMDDMNKPYWRDALLAFTRMSSWIVGPILIALFLGKWLDAKFHTAPIIFVSLTGLAFIISMVGLVKEGQAYLKSTESKINDQKKNHGHEPDNNS